MAIEIPIKNIYYMLCYSYDILEEKENINLSKEDFENIYDLFAKILINGVRNLIKRGFNREYVDIQEETTVLRGKIEINETLKKQSHIIDNRTHSQNITLQYLSEQGIASGAYPRGIAQRNRRCIELQKTQLYFYVRQRNAERRA